MSQGRSLIQLEKYDQALEVLKQGLGLARKIGDAEGVIEILISTGVCHSRQLRFKPASKVYSEALKLSQGNKAKPFEMKAHSYLADLFLAQGNITKAFLHSKKAVDLLSNGLTTLFDELVWFTHYKACLGLNKQEEAFRALKQAHTIIERKAKAIHAAQLKRSFNTKVQLNKEIHQAWKSRKKK
jgi:tetratricopeptide (TPR) repeat protein